MPKIKYTTEQLCQRLREQIEIDFKEIPLEHQKNGESEKWYTSIGYTAALIDVYQWIRDLK